MTTTRGPRDDLLDVAGLRVGHHHALTDDVTVAEGDRPGTGTATGTTVVLAPEGAVAAVDVRGGGPGTRETDALDPANSVHHVHAVVLGGGSAFGLAAADGVMRRLEETGHGLAMGAGVVPLVPAAVVFDLPVGDWQRRPDADFGYLAARDASSTDFARGSVGAGTGARAGALKGGVGSASLVLGEGPAAGVTVAALMVANPVGSVVDPRTGLPWGVGTDGAESFGLRAPGAAEVERYRELAAKGTLLNTTIGVVATDAALDRDGCRRVATAGHDGIARAVRPAHSPLDGDTIFALATGRVRPETGPVPPGFAPELAVRAAVAEAAAVVVERAIVDAVLSATTVAGIPAYRDVFPDAVT
ncbi:peptidase S58 family protein [Rhodococcus rhodnii]|uniref:Hydrolase n=2 Tax=Rhodococcus rhodnii TaxID=38312 RepID=R7WIW7_9NOCA|nr:P1 family peptidase [Rhodococcus rhodnii]EOM75185.1 hypothetical protein Rrhod_3520 [Rhodococcus rhodnii LMG 5362]TXG91613.1 peptidase S58 family protein [Rhodococcus rhodnii]